MAVWRWSEDRRSLLCEWGDERVQVMKRKYEKEPPKFLGHGPCDTFSKSTPLQYVCLVVVTREWGQR